MQSLNPLPKSKIPITLSYQTKEPSVEATLSRRSIQPMNGGTFAPGGTIQFDLPTAPGTYLDTSQSYIRFRLTNLCGVAATLSNGPASVIRQLNVQQGGRNIEQILNYHHCYSFLSRFQCGDDNFNTVRAAQEGLQMKRRIVYAAGPPITTTDDPTFVSMVNEEIALNGHRYFTHQLLSGIVGPLLPYYLPLGFMEAAGPLRVELQLENATIAMVRSVAGANNYSITDVEFNLAIITVPADVDAVIRSNIIAMNPAEPKCWLSTETYEGFSYVIPAAVTGASVVLPFKSTSAKSLYAVMQRDDQKTSEIATSVGSYIRAGLDYYRWNYGGKYIPNKEIRCGDNGQYVEAYAELLNAMMAMSNPSGAVGLSPGNYTANAHAATYGQAFFAIGQNLESFSTRAGGLVSGLNIWSQQLQADLTFSAALANAINAIFFMHADMALVIDLASGLAEQKK